MSFLDLPDELIVKIFSKAEKKDIFISGQVSQRFRKISRDDSLWSKVHMEIDRIPRQIFRFPHFQSEIQRTYWLPENYLTLRRQIWPAE